MKTAFCFSLFASLFLLASPVSAQMGMMGYVDQDSDTAVHLDPSTAVTAALEDIFTRQNAIDQSQINCAKVTDTQFEELGDAIMGSGISEEAHMAMEAMMGGEGSATLIQAHITMGRSYLSCWAGYEGGPIVMPMMGYLYSSTTAAAYNRMSNYYGPCKSDADFDSWANLNDDYCGGFHWSYWITTILVWAVLLLGIASLFRWMQHRNK